MEKQISSILAALILLFSILLLRPAFATVPAETVNETLEQSWKKIVKERLAIVYFSEFLGPGLNRLDDRYPDIDAKGNYARGPEPIQLWNQINFSWKLNSTWRLAVIPRWMVQLGERSGMASDNGILRTEDFLLGVQGVVWSNGPWSVWSRPGFRLPTSRGTRDANWSGQAELLNILDYTDTKTKWSFGAWQMYRQYIPTEETTAERWRLYMAPYVQYRITDKWRYEAYYETEIQHNVTRGERDWFYARRTLQSGFTGFTYQVNPSLSFFPFLRFYTVRKFDPATTGFGMWTIATLF